MTRKRICMALAALVLAVIAPLLTLALLLGVGGTAHADPPASFTKVSMPDLGQHSDSWCWVGAAANSFWWYGENEPGQEGLLGGSGKPWKLIHDDSTTPGSVCGTLGGTWYDSRDAPVQPPPAPPSDGALIPGYATVLKKIAETTFKDLNQDGIRDPDGADGFLGTADDENNYCYGEGVEEWDYLVGLSKYVNSYGSGLEVHSIIVPQRCLPGNYGMKPDDRVKPPAVNAFSPCGSDKVPDLEPGLFDQDPGPPTFTNYKEELSGGQDVLLWMEIYETGSMGLETAHVVSGVGYTTAGGHFGLGTVTISDPWTHTTNAAFVQQPPPNHPSAPSAWHTDGLQALWEPKPDHNTSPDHDPEDPGPITDPYNLCDVTQHNPLKIQCYNQDTGKARIWSVVDMIFVSPLPEADLEKVDLYVKPFYCGDSDLDGREDGGLAGGTVPGTGNCCDGADNDGDGATDGQDRDCAPYINEDDMDRVDNDDDFLIDEDPSDVDCPYDGDDDCDGFIDEDPKNMADDDQDGLFDEDPANGFLGKDNDWDGFVDEDGAGRFDTDGDTAVEVEQFEGVDDDGDTSVDEDPLDSPVKAQPEPKWEQLPDLTTPGLDVYAQQYSPVLADDFLCTESGPITYIDFWGSWKDDILPGGDAANVSFYLSIHADVPAAPPQVPYSQPGQLLWPYETRLGECSARPYRVFPEESPEGFFAPGEGLVGEDWTVWLYHCPISQQWEPFFQTEGTVYWLDVTAFPNLPQGEYAYFGWKTSLDHFNDYAVYSYGGEGWYLLEYLEGQYMDMAFRIGTGPEPTLYEPHYLIKELLRNNTMGTTFLAEDTKEIDAPAWRADALEDGLTTCNDGLNNDRGLCNDGIDNDRDGTCDSGGCKGLPPDKECSAPTDPEGDNLIDDLDPDCTAVHGGEEAPGLHSCNDGKDNGGVDGLIDEADPDCMTFSEVSVECAAENDFITAKAGVPWYIKPPSWDEILLAYPGCEQYHNNTETGNKCVPCKIPAAFFYAYYQMPVPDLVTGEYCDDLVFAPGYCIAMDSVPGVYKELDFHRQVTIPWGEDVLQEHQFDLSCEGELGQHKFIIQNEIQPPEGYIDPVPGNNELEMEMLVECVAACSPGMDSDLDGFDDNIECYLATDPSDNCPDTIGVHDAWPLDINMDTYVTVIPDIYAYRGRVNTTGGPPADPMWMQRLDLNADNYITVIPDIYAYRGNVNTSCN